MSKDFFDNVISRLPQETRDAIAVRTAEMLAEQATDESCKPRSPGLQHLYDRFIGDDPERIASYREALALAEEEHEIGRELTEEERAEILAIRAERSS